MFKLYDKTVTFYKKFYIVSDVNICIKLSLVGLICGNLSVKKFKIKQGLNSSLLSNYVSNNF